MQSDRSTQLLERPVVGYGAIEEEEGFASPQEVEKGKEPQPASLLDVTTMSSVCFICLCLGVFLGDSSRGLVAPSLTPYIEQAGGSSSFVGWTNGVYSVGRLVAAPLFGWWGERRTYLEAILVNLSIFVVGNLVYSVGHSSKWIILLARLLVGLGSGTLGLSRGYIAQTTSKKDRSFYIAWLTAAQFIGYSVTPGLGGLFTFIDITIISSYKLDAYTIPGYLMVLAGLANMAMMFFFWTEPPALDDKSSGQTGAEKGSTSQLWGVMSFQVMLFVGLQFLTRCTVATYETSSQLISSGDLHWSILTFGLVSSLFGIMGTIVLFLQKPLSRKLSDEWILVGGLIALCIGLFLFPPVSLFSSTPHALMIQYIVGSIFIFGLGYPISQALVLSLFSKALGPVPQSAIMGMMASLGSAARVVGALVAGWAYQKHHVGLSFYVQDILLTISTVGVAYYFSRGKKDER